MQQQWGKRVRDNWSVRLNLVPHTQCKTLSISRISINRYIFNQRCRCMYLVIHVSLCSCRSIKHLLCNILLWINQAFLYTIDNKMLTMKNSYKLTEYEWAQQRDSGPHQLTPSLQNTERRSLSGCAVVSGPQLSAPAPRLLMCCDGEHWTSPVQWQPVICQSASSLELQTIHQF